MTSKLLLTVALGCTVIDLCFSTASAQLAADAWKEPQDTFSSLFEPDRYAWRLFIALNWPANTATKEADAGKAFGADGPVVWETWRNVRPQAPDTVFPVDGSDPGPWLGGAGPVVAQEQQRFDRVLPTQQAVAALAQRRVKPPPPVPSFDGGLGGEVRMNKSTYEFIRAKKLFNVEGQIAQFNAGEVNLNFPPNAKEIKAEWRTIDPSEKPRYHWTEVVRTDGSREVWGLSALHIITKDLPNWFWATFEHIDTKPPNPVGPGWQFPSVDRVACPLPPHGCEQAPTGIGLQGTKWEHYRLRGTQIDFITSSGFPTQLSNSQLEAVQNSSCMTCHAMATIDRDGGTFGFQFIKGSPQPSWFQNAQGQRIFMQQDFVFSLTRASRANPP
jgi:hypothetical protein